jgi:hypothetical protein
MFTLSLRIYILKMYRRTKSNTEQTLNNIIRTKHMRSSNMHGHQVFIKRKSNAFDITFGHGKLLKNLREI